MPPRSLLSLEAQFLHWDDDSHWHYTQHIEDADGVVFVCPKCLDANDGKRAGVHSILCWRPRVPQSTSPRPGRWHFRGSSLEDLTLSAQSSSILLTSGCQWHGFIENGMVRDA